MPNSLTKEEILLVNSNSSCWFEASLQMLRHHCPYRDDACISLSLFSISLSLIHHYFHRNLAVIFRGAAHLLTRPSNITRMDTHHPKSTTMVPDVSFVPQKPL